MLSHARSPAAPTLACSLSPGAPVLCLPKLPLGPACLLRPRLRKKLWPFLPLICSWLRFPLTLTLQQLTPSALSPLPSLTTLTIIVVAFGSPAWLPATAARKTAFTLSEKPLSCASEGAPPSSPPYKVRASDAPREERARWGEMGVTSGASFSPPTRTPTARSTGPRLPATGRKSRPRSAEVNPPAQRPAVTAAKNEGSDGHTLLICLLRSGLSPYNPFYQRYVPVCARPALTVRVTGLNPPRQTHFLSPRSLYLHNLPKLPKILFIYILFLSCLDR